MRPSIPQLVLLVAGACVLAGSPRAGAATTPDTFSVLVRVGLTDKEMARWNGSVSVTGGQLERVEGWRFSPPDQLTGPAAWEIETDLAAAGPRTQVVPNGVILHGKGGAATRLAVRTPKGEARFALADLAPGKVITALDGAADAQRVPRMETLSDDALGEHDYPSSCAGPDGTVWAVWQAFAEGKDRVMVRRFARGNWESAVVVPGTEGEVWMPACAVDGSGKLWVVWSLFRGGDWDLFARSYDGRRWGGIERLTGARGSDINAALAAGPDGTITLVWQAHRGTGFDILMRTLRDGKWSAPAPVTDAPGNDWNPSVAVSRTGDVTVVWDTYRNGSYDVYARQYTAGKPGPEVPVAAAPLYEAHPSVAYDAAGRAWIAYSESVANWGKDQGYTLAGRGEGAGIYRTRELRVRVLAGGKLLAPADPKEVMPPGERGFLESPRVAADARGRVWLLFRHPVTLARLRDPNRRPRKLFGERAWENYAATYEGDRWVGPVYFPERMARMDTDMAPCAGPDGSLAVIFHTDGREWEKPRYFTRNRVFATTLSMPAPQADPVLAAVTDAPAPADVGAKERRDVERVRQYRVAIGGREHRILRGDLHRHTEVSWDGNGDGSMIDAFRYAIDGAAMDFLEVTDHNQMTGPDDPYVWWRTQKVTELFNNPPAFMGLFGYERSLNFPNGHRNIISDHRLPSVFPFTRKPEGGLADDDTKQLYAWARKNNTIVISHTSGTNMGTDWRDNDPELEPVAEIFQGARTSYEYEGAPKSATPGDRAAENSGYQPEGFLWRAWEKGLILGIIASSDHGSTHISYASVYAREASGQAILEALRKRHTFGATDNLVVDARMGDAFMGDIVRPRGTPRMQVRVRGTGELSRVDVIRDLKFVFTRDPEGTDFDFEWADTDTTPGRHMVYVRAQQADGQIAWGSPIWFER